MGACCWVGQWRQNVYYICTSERRKRRRKPFWWWWREEEEENEIIKKRSATSQTLWFSRLYCDDGVARCLGNAQHLTMQTFPFPMFPFPMYYWEYILAGAAVAFAPPSNFDEIHLWDPIWFFSKKETWPCFLLPIHYQHSPFLQTATSWCNASWFKWLNLFSRK